MSQVSISDPVIDTVSGLFTFNVNNAALIDSAYIIMASPQVSPGMNFREDIFRFIATGDITGPVDITAPYESVFGVSILNLSPAFTVWLKDLTRGFRFPSALLKVVPGGAPLPVWNPIVTYGNYNTGVNGSSSDHFFDWDFNLTDIQIVHYALGPAPVLTDNHGGVYTLYNSYTFPGQGIKVSSYYRIGNPAGNDYQWTVSGSGIYATVFIKLFKSSSVPSFVDVKNAGAVSENSATFATVTPADASYLFTTSVGVEQTFTPFNQPSGFAMLFEEAHDNATHFAAATAYKIKTNAAPETPSWSWPNGSGNSAVLGVFKA